MSGGYTETQALRILGDVGAIMIGLAGVESFAPLIRRGDAELFHISRSKPFKYHIRATTKGRHAAANLLSRNPVQFHAGNSPAVVKGAVQSQSCTAGAASAASLDAASTPTGLSA